MYHYILKYESELLLGNIAVHSLLPNFLFGFPNFIFGDILHSLKSPKLHRGRPKIHLGKQKWSSEKPNHPSLTNKLTSNYPFMLKSSIDRRKMHNKKPNMSLKLWLNLLIKKQNYLPTKQIEKRKRERWNMRNECFKPKL